MLYRVTYLNDNGYAIVYETVEAENADVARLQCDANHPMGRYGRVSVAPESGFTPPAPPPTFDRKTGRYSWPERKET